MNKELTATVTVGAGRVRRAEASAPHPRQLGAGRRAFTLIELLVVISIIGVLAGLLIPLAGVATAKMRISRVKAELNQLVTAIEGYKLETGEYPPDNGRLKPLSANDPMYRTNAALNPLLYELTGAVYTNRGQQGEFQMLVENEVILNKDLDEVLGVQGIRNSARNKADIDYKGFSPRAGQYAELKQGTDVEVLVVPVPGPFMVEGRTGRLNPWFYDASSTNRNNKNGFDLWAEVLTGKTTNIIGNWKN